MTIQVRVAEPSEYIEAGRVTAAAYREFVPEGSCDWESYLERIADVGARAGRTTIVVAVEDGRILGSATLELDGRTEEDAEPPASHIAHIRMLGVDPSARRRGVAKLLMAACEDEARARDRTELSLNTTHRMMAAQGMYESLGYVRGIDEVLPDGFVLLSYSKQL